MATKTLTQPGVGQDTASAMDVDVDGGNAVDGKEKETARKEKERIWRIRVCPIAFEDFSGQAKLFTEMIKLTLGVEYRVSQLLNTCQAINVAHIPNKDKDSPWLPNEKVFFKQQNAGSAGLMEMRVHDKNLRDILQRIRSKDLTKKNRMRFELIRAPLRKKKPLVVKDGENQSEDQGNKQVAETEGQKAEEYEEFQVNFSVRLDPIRPTAFHHPPGYTLMPKDKQIFLTRVPNDLPDHVLSAIMMSDVLERTREADGFGTAAFNVQSPLGAQGFMELYDGIMVNLQSVDMSTTLGTLRDARKIHSDKQQQNRAANEQEIRGMKRKPEGLLAEEGDAKKIRQGPEQELNPVSKLWLSSQGRPKVRGAAARRPGRSMGMMGSQRGTGGMRRPQLRGRPGGMNTGGGYGGRGKPPGRGFSGAPRGAGGAPARRGAARGRAGPQGPQGGDRRPSRGQGSRGRGRW